MQRNIELMLKILEFYRDAEPKEVSTSGKMFINDDTIKNIIIGKFHFKDCDYMYHLWLAKDMELIKNMGEGQGYTAHVLTWKGHDYLESLLGKNVNEI